nr:MAG TPA: hypothetical protein [Caudoviricetes sp.]
MSHACDSILKRILAFKFKITTIRCANDRTRTCTLFSITS